MIEDMEVIRQKMNKKILYLLSLISLLSLFSACGNSLAASQSNSPTAKTKPVASPTSPPNTVATVRTEKRHYAINDIIRVIISNTAKEERFASPYYTHCTIAQLEFYDGKNWHSFPGCQTFAPAVITMKPAESRIIEWDPQYVASDSGSVRGHWAQGIYRVKVILWATAEEKHKPIFTSDIFYIGVEG